MPEVQFQLHPDGRRAFPAVVQYRVGNDVLDLPPTVESHRDTGAKDGVRSLPWKPVVHDRGLYERLWTAGLLHSGHAYR